RHILGIHFVEQTRVERTSSAVDDDVSSTERIREFRHHSHRLPWNVHVGRREQTPYAGRERSNMLCCFLSAFDIASDQTDALRTCAHESAGHLEPDTTCSPDDVDRRLVRNRYPEIIRFVHRRSVLCRSSSSGRPVCT